MEQWQNYSEKFSKISVREQWLILLTVLVIIIFMSFNLFIDKNTNEITRFEKQIKQLTSSTNLMNTTIFALEQALQKDPNEILNQQIAQYESKLGKVDNELLELTSDLIDPVQMRYALINLRKMAEEKNLSLTLH